MRFRLLNGLPPLSLLGELGVPYGILGLIFVNIGFVFQVRVFFVAVCVALSFVAGCRLVLFGGLLIPYGILGLIFGLCGLIFKNIVFVFRVNDLSRISLEDEDLVVILANLLNNAIEACEKCEDKRRIKFKFMLEDGLVILSIKNTYNHPLIYDNDEIKTSKEVTPDEHGVGIKNIIRIVEKYSGSYIIQHDEDEFYFSIMLPS